MAELPKADMNIRALAIENAERRELPEAERHAPPFALDLSEAQVLWEAHQKTFELPTGLSDPQNLHGAWLDGFMHARGWRLDHNKAPKIHEYQTERAYDLHPQPLWALEAIRNLLNVVNDPQQIINAVRELWYKQRALAHQHDELKQQYEKPIPMLLWCPECGARHVDVALADKPHHTHACQRCGHCWRPAKVATVGVQFLPGYKDQP